MWRQTLSLALLVTHVSSQERSNSQTSKSTYIPDPTSWPSMTDSIDENINNQMTLLRYPQDGGQSSWSSMSDSFSGNGNSGSFSVRNLDSNSHLGDLNSMGQSAGLFESPYTAEPYKLGSSSNGGPSLGDSTLRNQNLNTESLWIDRNAFLSSRGNLGRGSQSNDIGSIGQTGSFSLRKHMTEPYNVGSSISDRSSSIDTFPFNQDFGNGHSFMGSNDISSTGVGSYLGDLNPIGQSTSSVIDNSFDPSYLGSSVSDFSSFFDSSRRGQDTTNDNSPIIDNNMLSMRGYTLPNNERLFGSNADLLISLSDRSFSVLDGSSFGQDLSGFPRSNQWDASYRERNMDRYPFQSNDRQSISDSGNRASSSMSMFQRRGLPWRNVRDIQRGLSQFDLNRRNAGRANRGGSAWYMDRVNMQRDMSDGQTNAMRNLDDRYGMSDMGMSVSRQEPFRRRIFLKMVPRVNTDRFASLPSSVQTPYWSSGLERGSLSDMTSSLRQRSQPSSGIDGPLFRSARGRTTSGGFRSSRMTTYPLQSDSATSGGRQGRERRRVSF